MDHCVTDAAGGALVQQHESVSHKPRKLKALLSFLFDDGPAEFVRNEALSLDFKAAFPILY